MTPEQQEIIRQLLKLVEEIEDTAEETFVRVRMSVAKQLLRKLSPSKSDGGNND